MRINKFRILGEYFHNLVGTLAASSHHHDVRFALLGYCVLKHSLAAAERPRNEASAALGYRVESVNDTHAGFHDLGGPGLIFIAFDGNFHRPFLAHGDIEFLSVALQHSNRLVYIV